MTKTNTQTKCLKKIHTFIQSVLQGRVYHRFGILFVTNWISIENLQKTISSRLNTALRVHEAVFWVILIIGQQWLVLGGTESVSGGTRHEWKLSKEVFQMKCRVVKPKWRARTDSWCHKISFDCVLCLHFSLCCGSSSAVLSFLFYKAIRRYTYQVGAITIRLFSDEEQRSDCKAGKYRAQQTLKSVMLTFVEDNWARTLWESASLWTPRPWRQWGGTGWRRSGGGGGWRPRGGGAGGGGGAAPRGWRR